MNIIKRTPAQLTLVGAALTFAIVAFALLVLAGGGGPAQADTAATLDPDGGHWSQGRVNGAPLRATPTATTTPTPTPTPRHATPESCPGEEGNPNATAAAVVDSGHIALFDVWWNPVEGEPTNSLCPPTITHVPAQNGGRGNVTPARDERSPSSIDITAEPPTIIHVRGNAKVNLTDSTTYGNTTYGDMYPGLSLADNRENRDTDDNGTPDGVPA